jgi:hypothetical protein
MHETDLCYRLFVYSFEAWRRSTEAQGELSTPAALQSSCLAHVTNYLSLHTCHHCTVPPIYPSIHPSMSFIHSAQNSTQQAEILYPFNLI